MTLEELARQAPFARPRRVPPWTLGCFHRRSITFADGTEDSATRVVWVQSHGLTGDIRIPPRPDLAGRQSLHDCTDAELVRLAEAEGWVGETDHDGAHMSWSRTEGFQPYDKWPEPGELRRVGGCMIEFAPSGAYVEDWRFQAGCEGLLAGLRLVSERGPDGVEGPRDGGLVVAGRHVVQVLARRRRLPERPAAELLPSVGAADVFDCEACYLTGEGASARVALSTDPFLEGRELPALDGFAPGPEELLVQSCPGGVTRTWRIDTLLPEWGAQEQGRCGLSRP